MAASNSEEEHHWPGYVDALTTMTMMLTFIMCILAIAIFGISQNISREMVEKMATAAHVLMGPAREKTGELAKRIIDQLETQSRQIDGQKVIAEESGGAAELAERLPGEGRQIVSLAPAAVAGGGQKVSIERAPALLTLTFQSRATSIDSAAASEMESCLKDQRRLEAGDIFEVKAYASVGGAVSDARRVAFYRLIEIRKRLIALGVPAARIEIRVDDRKILSDGNLVQIFSRAPA